MSRVPFGYSLVDKRHKGFVDGQRDVLLSLAHVMLSKGFIVTLILGGVGLFGFLRLGIGGLAYGFSVRNEWVTTDATIVSIVPVQRGDRFNWYYFYTFQTEDGEQVSGKTVEGRRDVFSEGQRIPVRYLRTNPRENVYANEKMPKSVLYWVLVAMGTLWVGVAANNVRQSFSGYRAMQAISHRGRAVPGEITGVSYPAWYSGGTNVEVDYVFTSPRGARLKRCDSVPAVHMTGSPQPGTVVAVWYVGDAVALLL